jgi:hypothetical protein
MSHFMMSMLQILNVLTLMAHYLICAQKGHHHMPETRGLCLSEEQTVNIVILFTSPSLSLSPSFCDCSLKYNHAMFSAELRKDKEYLKV